MKALRAHQLKLGAALQMLTITVAQTLTSPKLHRTIKELGFTKSYATKITTKYFSASFKTEKMKQVTVQLRGECFVTKLLFKGGGGISTSAIITLKRDYCASDIFQASKGASSGL